MIFSRLHADGTETEYALVASGLVGDPVQDEWTSLLDGKTTLDQWLHDVGAQAGDSLLLVRAVGA